MGSGFHAGVSVSFRINTSEDFLLELQLRARPDWMLVCYEGWSSALGARVCRSLGHLRLLGPGLGPGEGGGWVGQGGALKTLPATIRVLRK